MSGCAVSSMAPDQPIEQPPLLERDRFANRMVETDYQATGLPMQLSPNAKNLTMLVNGRVWISPAPAHPDRFFVPQWQPHTPESVRVTDFTWSSQGDYLIVQGKGAEGSGLWVLDMTHLESRPDDTLRPLFTDSERRAIVAATPRDTPDSAFIAQQRSEGSGAYDLYEMNLAEAKAQRVGRCDGTVNVWGVSPSGQVRFAQTQDSDGSTRLRKIIEGKPGPTLYHCAETETCHPVRFDSLGKGIYLKSNRGGEQDLIGLKWLDLTSGETRWVHQDPSGLVDLEAVLFHPTLDRPLAAGYDHDGIQWHSLDPAFANIIEQLEDHLGDQVSESNLQFQFADLTDHLFQLRVSSDRNAGQIYLVDHQNDTFHQLHDHSEGLPPEHLVPMKPYRYQSRDGLEIQGYLTRPPQADNKPVPLVALIHGGPWQRDSRGFDAKVQFLANRGYAVFQPNFRGSRGYGKHLQSLGNREWGGTMQQDITDGVTSLIKEGVADPERICIMGGSYGGYAALIGLALTPELYACGISTNGVTDLPQFLNQTRDNTRLNYQRFRERVGDVTDPNELERLVKVSPYHQAHRIQSPVFLTHVTDDSIVQASQSHRMAEALNHLGDDLWVYFPDRGGHEFQDRNHRRAWLAKLEAFLAMHLKGRQQQDLH